MIDFRPVTDPSDQKFRLFGEIGGSDFQHNGTNCIHAYSNNNMDPIGFWTNH